MKTVGLCPATLLGHHAPDPDLRRMKMRLTIKLGVKTFSKGLQGAGQRPAVLTERRRADEARLCGGGESRYHN